MLQQCATLQNRFAVLHTLPPSNNVEQDIKNYKAGIGNNNLKWGAVYYPWLITADNKTVPPCGAAAGVFAATDNSNGVWKAPVNISINNITNVTQPINNTLQEYMNIDAAEGKSVNAIRHFTGKGFLIWGGRTLAGNDNEWRYISVRRFTLMVLQSINEGIKAFAFEPNNSTSWIRVRGLIENFLTQLWRNGALAGVRPDHAFFVSVGTGITMSEADVQQGRMIIQVGLAVIRPAEFIISRVVIQLKS
jgi:uncharacterized protein